jgi:hypothetical protein
LHQIDWNWVHAVAVSGLSYWHDWPTVATQHSPCEQTCPLVPHDCPSFRPNAVSVHVGVPVVHPVVP